MENENNVFGEIMELRRSTDGPHFGVFDFDGSIIHHDSAEAVLHYMARHDIKNGKRDFAHYYELLDAGNVRTAYRFGACALQGFTISELELLVRRALEEEGTELGHDRLFGREVAKGIALRENVATLFRRLRATPIDLWVVSASPERIVRSAMNHFGLEAKVIGVQNLLDGYFVTGELESPLPIYEGKVSCIQKFIYPSVRPLFAIGDSMNDMAMLEYARLPIVVDRGNELAEKARVRRWALI